MAFSAEDLVLCSGTLPRRTGFPQRLAAAARAGFRGISLWGRDIQGARDEGFSDGDLRNMLGDHGLEVAELDPAWWWLPGAADVHVPPEADAFDIFRFGEDEMFEMAEAVGARSLNAVDVFGGNWDAEQAAEAFAGLCSRAAEHGLLVHVEWLAWSRIPDLAGALRIVELAGAGNGGLTVDAWHCARSGTTIEELAEVPGHLVLAVQLDDGPARPEADPVHATMHDRLLPGQGEFDLPGILGALRRIGAPSPFGVEVFSDELHALGADEAARQAARAMRHVTRTGGT